MAERPPRPGFRFPGPVPAEALEFFRAKGLRPSLSYLDAAAGEHALAFTVAKSAGFDILGDIKAALDGHLAEGGTFESFRKDLTPVLQKAGWWGEQEVTDPQTGEKRPARLGSPRRLKTIFRANMRSARAAGQWQRIQRAKATHPYLLYRASSSVERRAEHLGWVGTLLPADDPWWDEHFPPNGWGCKCWVRQVSAAEAARLGGQTARPPRDEAEWTNPRTGRTMRVDRGVDPSWAGNPGRDRERVLAATLAGDIAALGGISEALGREAVRQIVGSPLLERHLSGRSPGELPAGWIEPEFRRALGTRARVAVMTPGTAKKQASSHPDIKPSDWARLLPALFHDADLAVAHPSPEGGGGTADLDFAREFEGGQLWRLSVRGHGEDRVRLVTLHRIQPRHARSTARRGRPLRDRRGWGR